VCRGSHDAAGSQPQLCDVPGGRTTPEAREVMPVVSVVVLTGALGASLVAIVHTAAPQWRRIILVTRGIYFN
jgi:hypothetical protein